MAYINGNSILFSPRVNVIGGGGLRTYTDVETYVRLDIVSYNGSLYTPIVDEVSSVEPTNTEYWEEIIDAKVDKEYVEALETRIEKDNQTTKTEIANLEKEHEMFDKRIANVESATLAFTEDSSSAYEKIVPANSAKYALVNKIGGMTYKCNNLFNARELDGDERFSVNEDGSRILLEAVTVGNGYIYPRTKKLSDFCPSLREGDTVYIKFETANPEASISAVYLKDLEELWFTKNPRTITKEDLNSLMGFYGNNYMNGYTEPVTLLNFRVVRDKNTEFEPYFEGLRDTKVTELVSEGANLIPFPYKNTSKTEKGVTFTIQDNGGIALSGTPTEYVQFNLTENLDITSFPKVFTVSLQGGVNIGLDLALKDKNFDVVYSVGILPEQSITIDLSNYPTATKFTSQIKRYNSNVAVSGVAYPMINYGTSPAPYKPYRSGNVAEFKIKPKLIDILEAHGYGRGIEGYEGYIDLDRGVFVPPQTYRRVLNGTENWIRTATGDDAKYRFKLMMTEHLIPYTSSANPSPIVCDRYWSGSANDSYLCVRCCATVDNGIYFYDDAYQTVEDWEAHLAEHPLIVEYATESVPKPIDISEYLTDDNFIEVEGGGVIKAVSMHNNPAPTTISYVSAIGG